MITLTFSVTLNGTFLPMHIIYGGKTKKCLSRGVKFPSTFSLSSNPKHYINEKEVLKYLDEIIITYIDGYLFFIFTTRCVFRCRKTVEKYGRGSR